MGLLPLNRRTLLRAVSAASLYGLVGRIALADGRALITHRAAPLNAEPEPAVLRASFVTAVSDFYIRNHGDIPQLSPETYALTINRSGAPPLVLTLGALKTKFKEHTVMAVMQCAGNRRRDMFAVKPVAGDPWSLAAIGNARWTGVALGDVLRAAGVTADSALHVAFESHDKVVEDGETFTYGVSIPLDKAMAPDTLLAYAMNGAALTTEHGFPLRVVTPGYAGCRSPKWLAAITVQDKPSASRIQQTSYKLFRPDVTKAMADPDKGATINAMPITSAICEPVAGAQLKPGPCTVRGYAMATSKRVEHVEVSADGGKNWMRAHLDEPAENPWTWTFWSARLKLTKGNHELVVRAWNEIGQTQPENVTDIWNHRGYLSTAWHRVHVSAV
ncbi:MAG: molybdopterin-dependent oxidoreductase [Clostridia bacterium]|nr:molybdopterin-dependent oxidoreductase [Deltaproteobacteria bacterium]